MSCSVPGSWPANWLHGTPITVKPRSASSRCRVSRPAYCGVNPQRLATLTISAARPPVSAPSVVGWPDRVVTGTSSRSLTSRSAVEGTGPDPTGSFRSVHREHRPGRDRRAMPWVSTACLRWRPWGRQAVDFVVLGVLEAHVAGQRVDVGGMRANVVLATLLLEAGRVVPLTRLAEAVYGEEPPATNRTQIQNTVSALRRLLGEHGLPDAIETRPPGYLLRIPPDSLDLHRYQREVQ